MKRYEERLLEDMKSHRWKVLLSEKPAIYNLPTEILLLVIDYIECILTLRALRSMGTHKKPFLIGTMSLFTSPALWVAAHFGVPSHPFNARAG
ncbi:hypothetical protein M408DRAFT_31249 [Serendipita vermifera MAFF 305830]|uniref:Uncharacterized protein n=1 Tax=Serendipita vermifera MAFF 305830 TaxID=933852 RepID=A0A0C3AJ94_SERVB|nr:hypothetical protein M408DRAFT_31249 [Serendipita vermifera MAFF 305830]